MYGQFAKKHHMTCLVAKAGAKRNELYCKKEGNEYFEKGEARQDRSELGGIAEKER